MRRTGGIARRTSRPGAREFFQTAAAPVLTALTLATCASGSSHEADRQADQAVRDSVMQFMAAIPSGLASDGPSAWLRFFESGPSFFMASDGQVAFPGIDSAQAFLDGFSSSVATMDLVWEGIRVEPLGPGLATVGAAYRESITDTAGATVSFGGFMTAVARHGVGGWKLQSLHWSSPVPPTR